MLYRTCLRYTVNLNLPQWSILGRWLFTLHIAELADNIKKRGLRYHVHADDTQLCVLFPPTDIELSVQTLEACVQDIDLWMVPNRPEQNGEKAEVLYIHKARVSSKLVL